MLTWAWFVIKVGAASQHGLLVGGCDSADGLVSIRGHRGQEWGRWGTEAGRWGLWGIARSSGLQLTSAQPFLALCHAPSSPPELSVTCQNQSENLIVSASHVQVWTGWHQISGATRQAPYENRCPHYWVATALKDSMLLLVNNKSHWVTVRTAILQLYVKFTKSQF